MTTNDVGVVKGEAPKPWYAAYPVQRSTASTITRGTLLSWMKKGKVAGKDFVLVDLRRTDFEGGTIRGSINLSAQSLYPTIPSLYTLFSTAGIATVIWYCGILQAAPRSTSQTEWWLGSSRGRGSRAAGWFADYIQDQNDGRMESYALEEGIMGWATAGEEYVEMMDEYNASVWEGKSK
ncbi:hypothetical protein G7Y89_g1599 [Cudoniella acicularis]|uniref:Rhodanese domain-containing protein n=1 Tax=Cudoniella acicularis TaxID=354080 RepID=A0A8H4RXW1_9HELO|nr:hypothetical protein G7Y89_g1599 [Cudoniella acicularis]